MPCQRLEALNIFIRQPHKALNEMSTLRGFELIFYVNPMQHRTYCQPFEALNNYLCQP